METQKLAIMMSGSGSNAEEIIKRYIADRDNGDVAFEPVVMFTDTPTSNARTIALETFKDQGVILDFICRPITEFYRRIGCDDLRDLHLREDYDFVQSELFATLDIDMVALAGYDWVVTDPIVEKYTTLNVHPGDLRQKTEDGQPKYRGLAWVPSAKAILAGDKEVFTSVHEVTAELDAGRVCALSDPQAVPDEALRMSPGALLGPAKSLQGIINYIKKNPGMEDDAIAARYPIFGFASDCQNRLKEKGDWVIFPAMVDYAARNGLPDRILTPADLN